VPDPGFPWLPIGFEVSQGVHSGRLRAGGTLWQVIDAPDQQSAIVLIRTAADEAPVWWQDELSCLPHALDSRRSMGWRARC